MVDLIDKARQLRAAGEKITVECIDVALADREHKQSRDAAMAEALIAVRAAQPAAALVIYAGNVHTRKAGMASRPGYETMAMQLVRGGVAAIALDARYADGSAWVCTGPAPADCGPRFMSGIVAERGIHLERSSDGAYDGWFDVGAITASPPAGFPDLAAKLDAQLANLASSASAKSARALRAYKAQQYRQCADEFASIEPATADAAYGQACCLALAGDKDAALTRLRAAKDLGFKRVSEAEADPDLASLRGDPRWPFANQP
jgi:hypothetical protein